MMKLLFLSPSLNVGHVHLSCSVCVKYHSHRIISSHKLPGAAVCAWPGTKLWLSGTSEAGVCFYGYCMHCMHVWARLCMKPASCKEFFLPVSPVCRHSFHSCSDRQSLDLNCTANCSTHSWREKKVATKDPWQHKEEQLQAELGTAGRREDLALFISENIPLRLRGNKISFAWNEQMNKPANTSIMG